jgi:hypothetical protein
MVQFPVGSRSFSFCQCGLTGCGTCLPIWWVLGAFSPGIKCRGCEADCSPPSNAKVKSDCNSTSTSQCAFMVRAVKLQAHFAYTFYS